MILGLNPYLVFNGNGQEAVKFYEDILDAKVVSVQTFGDMPESEGMSVPNETKNRVLHARLKVGDSDLMISDTVNRHLPQTLRSSIILVFQKNNA